MTRRHLALAAFAALTLAGPASANTWIVAVESADGTYWERDAAEPALLSTATELTRDTLFILSEESDGSFRLRNGTAYVCDSYLGAGGPREDCTASSAYSSFELLGTDNIFEEPVGIRVKNSAFPRHYRLHADQRVVTAQDGDDRPEDLFRIVKAHAEIELGGGTYTSSNAGRTVHYSGDAIVPGDISLMALFDADLTITYNSEGRMSSFDGTVAAPLFPDHRFLSDMPFEAPNGARFSIGWDFPENFNENAVDLPIDSGRKYIYLHGTVGGEGRIAGMDLPPYYEVLLVIDHTTGGVYLYAPLLMFGKYCVGWFGITAQGDISWTPGRDDLFVPANRSLQIDDAHLWGKGQNGLFVNDDFGFGIQGEAAMTVHKNRLNAVGLNTKSVRKLGAKGRAGISLPLADHALDFTFADATLFYQHDYSTDWNGGRHWVTFAGELDTSHDIVLPYGMTLSAETLGNADIYARGYVDTELNDADEAFVDVEVFIDGFSGANGVVVEGLFHADESGVLFDGSVALGRTRVALEGHADSRGAVVAGELEYSFDIKVNGDKIGRVRAEIDVEVIMTAQPGVTVDARAQFCAAGSCDSTGASVSIQSDGRMRVCANIPVPEVGQRCTTLD